MAITLLALQFAGLVALGSAVWTGGAWLMGDSTAVFPHVLAGLTSPVLAIFGQALTGLYVWLTARSVRAASAAAGLGAPPAALGLHCARLGRALLAALPAAAAALATGVAAARGALPGGVHAAAAALASVFALAVFVASARALAETRREAAAVDETLRRAEGAVA